MAEITDSGKEKIQQALLKKGLELEAEWKSRVPVYTGRYRQSISTETVGDLAVVVGTNIPYAEALEYGGDPGTWPPVDELKTWVDRVISPDEDRFDKVTFLVGRKIFREGIRPQPSLRPAIRAWQS